MPAGDAKSYLIAFLATLEGDKAVIQGIKRMEAELRKSKDAMGLAEKGATGFGAGLLKLGIRALAVIPIWMALRSAYMGLINATGEAIRANMDFEEALARIRTVVSANSNSIEADMTVVTQKILDLAVTTRTPLKELANAFYFLRTADLTTAESVDALDSVLNLAVGTMNSVEDSARAVAGIYNTMGDSLGKNLTAHEKFQKISDVLAFTYAVQEVQLNELLAGYSKLAPFIGGLSDSFLDLTTLLGVLNTRLLKSGRAGTLTAQTVLQLTKNAQKLAEVFKITFDPTQPMSLIKTLEGMNDVFQQQGKLTQKQSDMLAELFGARGIVVPQLLLTEGGFKNLSEAIALATQNAEGYAQRMRDIREMTVQAQLERTKNIISVLIAEFLSASAGAIDMAHALDVMNDNLAKSQGAFEGAGNTVNFYLTNLKLLIDRILEFQTSEKELASAQDQSRKQFALSFPGLSQMIIGFTGARFALDKLIDTFGTSREEIEANKQALKDQFELDKQFAQASERLPQDRKRLADERDERTLKTIRQELEHQINIMKALGASALDIARIRQEAFKDEEAFVEINEREYQTQERKNAIIEEELKIRKQIKDEVLDAQLEILKMLGASELEILKSKEKELINSKGIISDSELLLELSKNRLQQEVALISEKQKEWDLSSRLFQQYVKADDFGKENLRRVMELIQLKPEELADQYNSDMFDRSLIDEYFNNFSQAGQDAVNKVIADMYDLPVEFPKQGEFDMFRQSFPLDLANQFGINLESGMIKAVTSFKEAFREAMQTVTPQEGLQTKQGLPFHEVIPNLSNKFPDLTNKQKQDYMQNATADAQANKMKTQMKQSGNVNIEQINVTVSGELNPEKIGEKVKISVIEELKKKSTKKSILEDSAGFIKIP